MKPVVVFDESGNSGANLLDPEQPVFVLASTSLSADLAAELLGSVAGEVKFANLRRKEPGRRKVLDILNSPLLSEETILLSGYRKQFMVITKIVDLLVEPLLYDLGIDLNERGANLALANMLYFAMPAFVGRHAFDAIVAAFVAMVRTPSTKTATRFYSLLEDARRSLKKLTFAQELDMLLATKAVAEDYLARWDASDLDPAIPAFVHHGSIWTSRLNVHFAIVHDASKPIQQEQRVLEAMMSATDDSVHIGYDRRKMVFPIKADGIEFRDSASWPQLQFADVLAGSAAYCLRAAVRKPSDPFAKELAQTRALSVPYYPLWPEFKFTPEALGTTEVGGTDASNFIGAYVAQRLGGIPPKGSRSKR